MKLTNPSHRSLYCHYDPELIDSLSDDFIYISGNFKYSKKTDQILEMAGLGFFINHICQIRL